MTDTVRMMAHKNHIWELERDITRLKVENAALQQRVRDLLTAVQLNEGIIKELKIENTSLNRIADQWLSPGGYNDYR